MPLPLPLDTGNQIGSLVEALDKTTQVPSPEVKLGENGCPEYSYDHLCKNTEGALVTLFAALTRNSPREKVSSLFHLFLKSLKGLNDEETANYCRYLIALIFQTRDCRGGKGERDLFRWLLLEAYPQFPKTIENLVSEIPTYGYWKDLTILLTLTTESPEKYAGLQNAIYTVLTEQIRIDYDNLQMFQMDEKTAKERGEPFTKRLSISLASKWAPREGSSYDRRIKVAKELARRIFPVDFGVDFRVAMKHYRKTISQLNEAINTTETLMCAKRFSEIRFELVPGKCLTRYRRAFGNLDKSGEIKYPEDKDRTQCRENYLKFIEDVKNGKRKVNANQLFIHEIVNKLRCNGLTKEEIDLYEICWNSIVEDYRKQLGEIKLGQGVILADVSGSMEGTPMDVSIAAAIFVSSLLEEPYRDRFMTFDTNPQWFHIPTELSLQEKITIVEKSPWGGSTDFKKAMELILDVAKVNKLSNEQMPKWFLVLSDMQFNQAGSHRSWDTTHQDLQDEFTTAGLKACGKPYDLPHMIYWNLRGDTNGLPVVENQTGATLISGFSVSVLKEIFKNQDLSKLTPWTNLQGILDSSRYKAVRDIATNLAESPYFTAFRTREPDVVGENETSSQPPSQGIFNYISSFFSKS